MSVSVLWNVRLQQYVWQRDNELKPGLKVPQIQIWLSIHGCLPTLNYSSDQCHWFWTSGFNVVADQTGRLLVESVWGV